MKKILSFVLVLFSFTQFQAQNLDTKVIASSGESFEGNSMQIDWTLGEVAITTIGNSSGQITQGFHQPSYTFTNINELPSDLGKIKVYPNPSSDRIEMELDFDVNRTVKIQLMDMNRRLILEKKANGNHISEVFNIATLPPANYLINFIIDSNQYLQTTKIQKFN